VPVYLTDSSIWIAARRAPRSYPPQLPADRLRRDEMATCVPVAPAQLDRALELLRELAGTTAGAHRRRPIDYVVAACAEAGGEDVVLWHGDSDLTLICDHAGIAHEAEHDRAKAAGLGAEPGGGR